MKYLETVYIMPTLNLYIEDREQEIKWTYGDFKKDLE